MAKKLVSSVIIGCLVGGLMLNPMSALANSEDTKILRAPAEINGAITKVHIPLDKAVVKAKELFAIPVDYDRFESGLNVYDGRAEWNLSWTRSKGSGHMSVRINAMTGEVVGMDRWEEPEPGQKFSGFPKYSAEESQKLAQEWIKKLLPNYYANLKIAPSQQEHQPFFGLGERGQSEYYFNFYRMVNNISFPDNGVHLRISGDTGEILGYNLNWDERLVFPSATGLISNEQAKKVFVENLELVYFRPNNYENRGNPVKLIYRVKNGSRLFIDAYTGKVVEEPGYYYDMKMGMGGDQLSSKYTKELTPVEQAEVDKVTNLITAEKALEQLRKVVKIPDGIKQQESRLMQDYQFPEQKIWNFYWSGQIETTYLNLDASVNAATGELLSFNIWNKPFESTNNQPKHNAEQARQIAESFIKKQQATKFVEVRLEASQINDYISIEKSIPKSYSFSYTRLVNGIPFPGNGFNVQVDPFTGEVTNYRMSWWNLVFPAAGGYIETIKAADTFLAETGLTLGYQRLYREGKEPQLKLVYQLSEHPSYMLDAISGIPVDWNGQPIPAKQTREFTDISGHPAEKDINLLAKAKIVRSLDGTFRPDVNITKIEAIEWLLGARGWVAEPTRVGKENLDERRTRLINAAINFGIIEKGETEGFDQELTRLELARLMINNLDYDGAAKLSKIYNLSSKDATLVAPDMKGFAALSLGLGIQTEAGGFYRPAEKVSRGYAATSIVRMLKVQK